MQYCAFEPDIEILGAAVYATIEGFGPFKSIVEKLLHTNGLAVSSEGRGTASRESWYSQQAWLGALRMVEERFGRHVVFKIGAAIPKNAVFPPMVTDVHSGLQSIDVAYHLNHRRQGRVMFDADRGTMLEGIGHYGYERVSATCVVSRCVTPYPCHFDLGIVTAMAQRFAQSAQVEHVGNACRCNGDDECEYEVNW